MSSNNYGDTCPKCGGSMECCESNRPYTQVSGECLHCGFTYYTTEAQMSLEEVNEARIDGDLKPLKKLSKQTEL